MLPTTYRDEMINEISRGVEIANGRLAHMTIQATQNEVMINTVGFVVGVCPMM